MTKQYPTATSKANDADWIRLAELVGPEAAGAGGLPPPTAGVAGSEGVDTGTSGAIPAESVPLGVVSGVAGVSGPA
jgi:hypothetical protein